MTNPAPRKKGTPSATKAANSQGVCAMLAIVPNNVPTTIKAEATSTGQLFQPLSGETRFKKGRGRQSTAE